ncbi:hypothetical protein DL96DRAFT_1739850 [Flagelloscypha sp. PMI_526]|nr:hypothetical protein DL96DRAFT_1739850 [Flagelloscypha sp. PMI_526]
MSLVPALPPAGSVFPSVLPQHLQEKYWTYFSSVLTVNAFLAALENTILETRWQPTQLKNFTRIISDDLAAVTNLSQPGQGLATLQPFWSFVLAIAAEYRKQGRVLEALVAMLQKVEGTTRGLRILSPVQDDVLEVTQLSQTIIRLLSCVLPKPFLVISQRSPDSDKLLSLPEVQENLQQLSVQVRLLQRRACARKAMAMGGPRPDL